MPGVMLFTDTIVCQAAVSVSFHWLLGPDSIFLNGHHNGRHGLGAQPAGHSKDLKEYGGVAIGSIMDAYHLYGRHHAG